MQLAKKFFDFYIKASIHVGFAVFCLVKITQISNDLKPINYLAICVFFGTILGYNFLKYFQLIKDPNFNYKSLFWIIIVTLIALIGFLYYFCFLSFYIQKYLLISGSFVLVYPFLRNFGWLKLFLVSFAITYITVFIPYQTEKWLLWNYDINLIQRFLIIISLLIPFEIFDSKTDAKIMKTLPQVFGINKTKIFGILLLIPFVVLEFLKTNTSIIVVPIAVITAIFIRFTSLQKSNYYTSFWVESIPIFWWILLCYP